VKALLAADQPDTRPDPAGHAGFFLWGHVPDPHTLYRGISALPAGTSMWVDAKGPGKPAPFFDLCAALASPASPAWKPCAFFRNLATPLQLQPLRKKPLTKQPKVTRWDPK
jgi:hypothetical protein